MRRRALLAGALAALALWGCAPRRAARTASPPASVSSEDLAKLAELSEILAGNDDNDPRIDRDFNELSETAKRLFRDKYRSLPLESRNDRGTIVYLIGRNALSPDDWVFLHSVVTEPPCLSLGDCSRPSSRGKGFGEDVTLAYPSMVALKVAEAVLEKGGPDRREALAVAAAARSSRMPAAARLAEDLERRFGNSR